MKRHRHWRRLWLGALAWGLPATSGGTDYHIRRNKFGIEGVDKDVAQAMVKWTF